LWQARLLHLLRDGFGTESQALFHCLILTAEQVVLAAEGVTKAARAKTRKNALFILNFKVVLFLGVGNLENETYSCIEMQVHVKNEWRGLRHIHEGCVHSENDPSLWQHEDGDKSSGWYDNRRRRISLQQRRRRYRYSK
jgi:hypothetical protein